MLAFPGMVGQIFVLLERGHCLFFAVLETYLPRLDHLDFDGLESSFLVLLRCLLLSLVLGFAN